jgi:EpsD family peptidyl-prolyl cis-trans isomerase
MRALVLNGLLIGATVLLSACGNGSGGKDKLEKGQVIATVNGEDVTVYELGTELQGMNLPSGDARKKIEQAALQRIVDRKILADIARERKLDKTPDYLLQTRRSDEQLLVNLLQQNEAAKIPASTSEDVEKFIAANPWVFSQRKLLVIDQIQFPMPADRKALMAYRPLKTLDEVEQKLVSDGIGYRRVPTSLDTAQMTATMAKSIMTLPTGEVFVVPAAGGLTANRIVEARSTPMAGPEAMKLAREMLRRQNMVNKATAELEPLLVAAREKVTYQAAYAPKPDQAGKGTGTAAK